MTPTARALELFHLGAGSPDPSNRFDAVGRDLPRVDGRAKVTGAATYAAEWPVEGLVHGAVVDSAVARGTIRAIDASAALAAPGVLAVVTHENAPRLADYPKTGAGFPLTGEGGLGEVRQPLQEPVIHYGAQSIAVVVAETAEQARHAAALVRVWYDAEPPEVDMDRASWTTRPKEFSGGEALQRGGDSVETALASAPVRLEREYENPVYHHNPIEILASIANWETRDSVDHLMLYDTTRSVDMLRDVVCHSFGLKDDRSTSSRSSSAGPSGPRRGRSTTRCWSRWPPRSWAGPCGSNGGASRSSRSADIARLSGTACGSGRSRTGGCVRSTTGRASTAPWSAATPNTALA